MNTLHDTAAYGLLNITPKSRQSISWQLSHPFRPYDILLWGCDWSSHLESFRIGFVENLTEDGIVIMHVLKNPFMVSDLKQTFRESMEPTKGQQTWIHRQKLRGRWQQVNRGLTFITGSPLQPITIDISGPVSDIMIIGETVESVT